MDIEANAKSEKYFTRERGMDVTVKTVQAAIIYHRLGHLHTGKMTFIPRRVYIELLRLAFPSQNSVINLQDFVSCHGIDRSRKARRSLHRELDVVSVLTLFRGFPAKDWEDANPELKKEGLNIRDTATINQLVVLSNMEALNAELIKQGVPKDQRKSMLHKAAKEQLAKFNELQIENKFSKLDHLKNPKYLK